MFAQRFPIGSKRSLAGFALVLAFGLLATPVSAAEPEPYGWPWLRNALDALRPSVDTRLPESATATAQRLEAEINAGRVEAALNEIEQRLAERSQSTISGTDVRLVFLRARALAALGRLDAAREAYQQMTISYPELPEPWNNLALVLVAQGQLEQAREALEMALLTLPDYAQAHANLGDVLVLQAAQAYARAAELGVPDAAGRQRALQTHLPITTESAP